MYFPRAVGSLADLLLGLADWLLGVCVCVSVSCVCMRGSTCGCLMQIHTIVSCPCFLLHAHMQSNFLDNITFEIVKIDAQGHFQAIAHPVQTPVHFQGLILF